MNALLGDQPRVAILACPRCKESCCVGALEPFWAAFGSYAEYRFECCGLIVKKAEFATCVQEVPYMLADLALSKPILDGDKFMAEWDRQVDLLMEAKGFKR